VFQQSMAEDPFETVVAAHHPEIHRYLRRVAPRASDADDLSQETFLRAYRAWRSLPDGANVRAWLFAIATNLCRNHYRSESRRSRAYAAVQNAPDPGGPAPDGEAVGQEARVLVERVVDGLPMKQRLAFIMRKVHDVEYDAIGQSLGCSAESARAHVFQALKKIRVALDGRVVGATEEVR
jgi:RNA polymerase sigma factor (sigma-70 family)